MFITSKMLKQANACPGQLHHFETLFPDGVVCTEALCVAHATAFDWSWAACNLLPPDAFTKFQCVSRAAGAEYERVRIDAEAEYERGRIAAEAAAWAEYERGRIAARAEYIRTQATTFGRLAEAIE